MFFLIMLRIIAIVARNQHEALEFRMHKLSVAAFAADHARKSSGLKVGHQLAYFTRHPDNMAVAFVGFQQNFIPAVPSPCGSLSSKEPQPFYLL
jgi:hypothetical protein